MSNKRLKYLQKRNRGITVINIIQAPEPESSALAATFKGVWFTIAANEQKQFCGIIQIHEHVVAPGTEYSFQRNQTFLDHKVNLRRDDAKTQHKTKSILRALSERIANG